MNIKNKESLAFTNDLIDFIDKSPTAFQAVDNLAIELKENGYRELFEGERWQISRGDKCFVTRNDSSIIAFRVPKNEISSFMIIASHSDSPNFKVKPNPEMVVENKYVKLNVEKYGGMICSTWFDKPLSVAGRVMVNNKNGVETKLVNIDRDLVVIPNLAIHMNREVNNGYKFNAQKDMLPLFGDNRDKRQTFLDMIADDLDVKSSDILGTDLFLYNRTNGTVWGRDSEYFSSGRIDNLECAYASSKAFAQSSACDESGAAQVLCVFDNEEVGSGTKQGAKSTFLYDTLIRIIESLGMTQSDFLRVLSSSFMLSADNGHAVHPNYADVSCPTNRPYINGGVLIKYNAQQKYTTDALSESVFKKICKKADVSYQEYVNKSDVLGGSTLGNLSCEHISINTVDIGVAQLAMHSSYETAGVLDGLYIYKAMKQFFETEIISKSSGILEIR